jgi:hypothetical protein
MVSWKLDRICTYSSANKISYDCDVMQSSVDTSSKPLHFGNNINIRMRDYSWIFKFCSSRGSNTQRTTPKHVILIELNSVKILNLHACRIIL